MPLWVYLCVGVLTGVLNTALGYSLLDGDWQAWVITISAPALLVIGELFGNRN